MSDLTAADPPSSDKELYLRSMALFDRAMEVSTDARADFVRREAADDDAVREQVLGMLAEIDAFTPTSDGDDSSPASSGRRASAGDSWWPARPRREALAPTLPGTRVGPYRILRLLNRGGMGEV